MSKEGGRVRESEREIEEERKTKMYSTIFVPDISLQRGSHNAFTVRSGQIVDNFSWRLAER